MHARKEFHLCVSLEMLCCPKGNKQTTDLNAPSIEGGIQRRLLQNSVGINPILVHQLDVLIHSGLCVTLIGAFKL